MKDTFQTPDDAPLWLRNLLESGAHPMDKNTALVEWEYVKANLFCIPNADHLWNAFVHRRSPIGGLFWIRMHRILYPPSERHIYHPE